MLKLQSVQYRLHYQQGLTLIEIMVVISILGIMATIATIAYTNYIDGVKVETTQIQMKNIVEALDACKAQYQAYPSSEQGLRELVLKGVMRSLPKDGWDREFTYELHDSKSFTITSWGEDGKPGGQGLNKDLVVKIP